MTNHTDGLDAAGVAELTDGEVKKLWQKNGGSQHGPHVETYTIPEVGFFSFIVDLEIRLRSAGERETAWLIERKFPRISIGSTGPGWFAENANGWHWWTSNPHEAKRFPSKADAEAFPAYQMIASDPAISITEHVWINDGFSWSHGASPTPSVAALHESALADIAAERQRQISAEGWTTEHDDTHGKGEMAYAAACYALTPLFARPVAWSDMFTRLWPWDEKWWKPTDRRRDLIKAGALIVAEIERLDRASKRAI